MRRRPRVLLVHPDVRPPGGAAGVTAWMLQALKDGHDVTLLTLSACDVGALNACYGTALAPGDVRVQRVLPRAAAALDRIPLPLALLRNHLLYGRCRRIGGDYDLVVNTTNEAWLGRPGIQYVHFPWGYWPRPAIELRWFHRLPGLLRAYYACCAALSAFDATRLREDLVLVNSEWTGAKVRELYGGSTVTLYPPVADPVRPPAWDERARAFLCVGRIAPEKELEKVVRIVARLRQARPELRLRLVGAPSRAHAAYHRRIRRLVAAHADWLSLEEGAGRARLGALMARHRYALHGMLDEHFGMAVAELARAGCIVFAHDSGGQREIAADARLLYSSEDDAVAKIERVLADASGQARLSAELRARAERFASTRFVETLRGLVAERLPATAVAS